MTTYVRPDSRVAVWALEAYRRRGLSREERLAVYPWLELEDVVWAEDYADSHAAEMEPSDPRKRGMTTPTEPDLLAPGVGSELRSEHSVEASGAKSDEDMISLWLAGRPETTRRGYGRELEWWRRELGGELSLRELRLRAIVRVLDRFPRAAPATMARRIAALRSLLAFGHRTGYLAFDVGAVLRAPRGRDELAERILEPDQVMALLAAARTRRNGARDHAIVRTLYATAARVSELVALDVGHVHRAHGAAALTLHGKGGRTRHVWISAGTLAELEPYLEGRELEAPLFVSSRGRRITPRQVQRIVAGAAKRAGLRVCSPHWLRHAHATHALERGAPVHVVSTDLGHASVSTTTRYLHARPGVGSGQWLGL